MKKFTTTKPIKEGFYWYTTNKTDVDIVEVSKFVGILEVSWCGSDALEYLDDIRDGWWAGPLPPPNLPKEYIYLQDGKDITDEIPLRTRLAAEQNPTHALIFNGELVEMREA